jgi:5,10-methylene-tetrahydrofolate dehydrogenase/methenyl tetrahydrofolate cyclohydrolase
MVPMPRHRDTILAFGAAPVSVSARLASRHASAHALPRLVCGRCSSSASSSLASTASAASSPSSASSSASSSSSSSFLAAEEDRIARHAKAWKLRGRLQPAAQRPALPTTTTTATAPPPQRSTTTAMDGEQQEQKQQQRPRVDGLAAAATTTPASVLPAAPHAAALLDGAATAAAVKRELAAELAALAAAPGAAAGRRPGLAVVIVGERRDSQTYVRAKHRACEEVGIESLAFALPESCGQQQLVELIDTLNARQDVHGILVQLPLPDGIDNELVLGRIALEKDVDGFHPLNIGRLCMSGRTPPLFVPCTPKGCIDLLDRYHVPIEGKHAVVVGRSNIVGLPVAMLLLHRNATVTICHSRTQDLADKIRSADIIVAACGRPNFIKGEWLKQGAVVIDVGINAVDDPTKKRGYRLVGDVEFEAASASASLITPVPGGVGPMTIAMLLTNTVDAAKRAWGVSSAEQGHL